MVYKLGHEAEIGSLPYPVSGKLYDNLAEFLIVLDNEYGVDRDVEQDALPGEQLLTIPHVDLQRVLDGLRLLLSFSNEVLALAQLPACLRPPPRLGCSPLAVIL